MRRFMGTLVISLVIMAVSAISTFPQDWASPAGGGWIEFDGEDGYAVAEDGSLNIDGDFTIEAWIYPGDTLEEYDEWVIIAKPGSFELLLVGGGNHIIANRGVDFAIFWRVGNRTNIMDASLLRAKMFDEWHHIAISGGKKAQLSLYFDGQKRGFDPTPMLPLSSRSDLHIGGIPTRGNSFFEGGMDEVHISSEILEPERLRVKAGRDTIALWHFDKWKFLEDSSGNKHILTVERAGMGQVVRPAGRLTTTWAGIKVR